MGTFISHPSDVEKSLIDSIYYGMVIKSFEQTKNGILKIPLVSSFERINFYLFKEYAVTMLDVAEAFEEKLKDELKDVCRKIIKYCKE